VAAVELVVLMPLLVGLLAGLWEVGRIVMVNNIMDNATREGCRLAISGGYFSSSNYLDPVTQANLPLANSVDSSGNPIPYDVQKRVITYLQAAGLSTTGISVQVQNIDKNWSGTYPSGTSGVSTGSYDPAAAADQLNHVRVTVQLPYSSVQWSNLAIFVPNSTTLTSVVDGYSLRNVPVTMSTALPQAPQ
jgi:Flp pilus assembly protein TadG